MTNLKFREVLGGLLIAALMVMLGCGSDNNKPATPSGKSQKPAAMSVKPEAKIPLQAQKAGPAPRQDREPDPRLIEVIPPTKPGEKGMTLDEVLRINAATMAEFEKIDPRQMEMFPPDKPGGKGITVEEFYRENAKTMAKVDPGTVGDFPPAKPGGQGIPRQELNSPQSGGK